MSANDKKKSNTISTSDKVKITGLFGACCFVLGIFCGAIVWLALKLISVFTILIWDLLPETLGINSGSVWGLVFNIAVCLVGAMLVALIIHKWGFMPHTAEEAFEVYKNDGKYPYNNLLLVAFCAIVPLIFGATLGPEAGLMGLIIGLCCWVGDSLKVRAKKLMATCRLKAGDKEIESFRDSVVKTGAATVLTIVFATPLAGVVNNLETEYLDNENNHQLLSKTNRAVIYIFGVLGGIIVFKLLGFGFEALCQIPALAWMYEQGGLPRFPQLLDFDWMHIVWLIPLTVAGMILGGFSLCLNWLTNKIASKIKNRFALDGDKMTYLGALLLTVIAAIILAIVGFFLPVAMYSGEHQLGLMMENYRTYVWWMLVLVAFVKISLATICFNFGWKGGLIFPIIFSGAVLGLGLSMVIGVHGFYAAAVTCASSYAVHAKKPATVIAILLLVFPITYLPYTIISAIVATCIIKAFSKKIKVRNK